MLWTFFSEYACVILGDFCYFCHWADDSAGEPEVPEVMDNPVAIYDMIIFQISTSLGMADNQYTRDNHTQMHVYLRSRTNKCWLGFKHFIACTNYSTAEETWFWLKCVLLSAINQSINPRITMYCFELYHHTWWLILFYFKFWSVQHIFHCCSVGKSVQILHLNCCLVFERFVENFL